jgi:hypothetical protein
VEAIKLEEVNHFTGCPVEITIYDQQGSDQAPSVKKLIKKVQYCPDHTHIRFYFDDFYFLAVPRSSEVQQSEFEWSAFDSESGLHYTIKKVQVF